MIHRYNLADLNLPQRMTEAPNDATFKRREELKFEQDWKTTQQNAFGTPAPKDSEEELKKT
jgi:hypothetical protein